MKRPLSSLGARLVASHLAAVFVGVVTVALTAGPLTERLFTSHVAGMGMSGGMMGGTSSMMEQLQASLLSSFRSALVFALAASAVTAVVASVFAARRIVRPVERMSLAARRLAGGDYRVRVPVPDETELAMLARDVNTLAETLERTEERRLRLMNEIAHELRTPLTTIEGYMEGLLDGVFQPSEEIFGATAREAARLKRLAADLSDLSRAEEGELDLRRDRLDLGEIAREVADRLRPLFVEKEVTLVLDAAEELPVVGDRDRLTQVLVNIVGNAVTYTPPGGTVTIESRRDRDRVSVAVVDTGKGIAPEDLDRVFDRFHRVDPNLPGGTGVGLTVARSLVRRHGGEITAFSDGPGRGSRFVVTLPAAS